MKAALKREELLLRPPEDLKRVKRRRVPWDRLDEETARDIHIEEHRYDYWLRDEVNRLRGEEYWTVFLWIWERPEYRQIVEEHLNEATGSTDRPPETDLRQWLALLRPLEALGLRTGGVERSCVELHRDGQLDAYLRNALSNERIMLEREDARVRLGRRRQRNLRWLDELEEDEQDGEAEEAELEGSSEE